MNENFTKLSLWQVFLTLQVWEVFGQTEWWCQISHPITCFNREVWTQHPRSGITLLDLSKQMKTLQNWYGRCLDKQSSVVRLAFPLTVSTQKFGCMRHWQWQWSWPQRHTGNLAATVAVLPAKISFGSPVKSKTIESWMFSWIMKDLIRTSII